MSDDEKAKRRKGTATLHEELAADAKADEADARREAREMREAMASAMTSRAQAAEESARLWFRMALALVAVLAMLVGGVVAVGAGVEIPGVGSFHVSKAGGPSGTAPLPVMNEEDAP